MLKAGQGLASTWLLDGAVGRNCFVQDKNNENNPEQNHNVYSHPFVSSPSLSTELAGDALATHMSCSSVPPPLGPHNPYIAVHRTEDDFMINFRTFNKWNIKCYWLFRHNLYICQRRNYIFLRTGKYRFYKCTLWEETSNQTLTRDTDPRINLIHHPPEAKPWSLTGNSNALARPFRKSWPPKGPTTTGLLQQGALHGPQQHTRHTRLQRRLHRLHA